MIQTYEEYKKNLLERFGIKSLEEIQDKTLQDAFKQYIRQSRYILETNGKALSINKGINLTN